MEPTTIILAVVAVYFAVSLGLGFWVARGERNVADDYFLAGRKLPWYAVSLSMTGSNIGTEHFMGMVGTAYALGLAPATFEWGNFIPYSILIWIFLPFFFRKKLFTVPEFLERRYNRSTRSVFAGLTLFHMVLVMLVPALYAGGRILYEMPAGAVLTGLNLPFIGCIAIIAAVTATYCIYGGLLSVVWTDVLQVAVLLVGGLLLVWIGTGQAGGISKVVENNRETLVKPLPDGKVEARPAAEVEGMPDEEAYFSRTSLLLPVDHPVSPWTGVATFWFTLSLWYVGTNQFYIQRCLGARSEWDAKMGVIGCAFLKVFLPVIIVFPGLVAFTAFGPGLPNDAVYVKMIKSFLNPLGQGIMLAVLVAAIMSTVSSVLNSASTIWSIDVYQRILRQNASEAELVKMGRWSTFAIILIGAALAPLLLWYEKGIFIYIQDMAALFAPPISVIFLAAFLWRRAHGRAATFTLVFGIVAGAVLWIGTEVLWMRPNVDLQDPIVRGRLIETADPALKKHLAEDSVVARRRAAITEQLAQDSAVRARIAEIPEVQAHLAADPVIQKRLDAVLGEFAKDAAVREQIAANPDFRSGLAADPAVRKRLAEDSPAQLRIAADPVFREHLAADPVASERFAEDSAVWEHLAGDALVKRELAQDSLVQKHLARRRLAGWLPWLGEGAVEQTVFAIGWIKPLLNRAAVTWALCLVAMIVATLALRQDPKERYDPDTIWNPRWARLPAHERTLNRGWRNLMFWWLLMVAASGSLFVIFR